MDIYGLTEACEVLTERGFVPINRYRGEKIMQVNSRLIGEFVSPICLRKIPNDGKFIHIKGKRYKIFCGKDTGVVTFSGRSDTPYIKIFRAESLLGDNSHRRVPSCLRGVNNNGLPMSDDAIRLKVYCVDMFSKDEVYYYLKGKGSFFYGRISKLLESEGIKYVRTDAHSLRIVYSSMPAELSNMYSPKWISGLDNRQLSIWMEEMKICFNNKNMPAIKALQYSTDNESNLLIVQALAFMAGYKTQIQRDDDKRTSKDFDLFILLGVNKHAKIIEANEVRSSNDLYAIDVPSGMIVVRLFRRVQVSTAWKI